MALSDYEKMVEERVNREIDRVWKYYRSLGAALALIGTVAVSTFYFLHGNSIREMKADMRDEVDTLERRVSTRVDQELQSENMRQLIADGLKKKIDATTEPIIASKVSALLDPRLAEVVRRIDRAEDDLAEIGLIADMASRMRVGIPSGLLDLRRAKKEAPTERLKSIAADAERAITNDYDRIDSILFKKFTLDDIRANVTGAHGLDPAKTTDLEIELKMCEDISKLEELNRVSFDFLALRKMTKIDFRMFDFEAVEKWAKNAKEAHGGS